MQEPKISYQSDNNLLLDAYSPPNPLGILDEIIENLKKKLSEYARKPNANQSYIDSQNEIIFELTEAFNCIELLQRFDTWILIEAIIIELAKQDAELTSVMIKLPIKNLNNNSDKSGFIDLSKNPRT